MCAAVCESEKEKNMIRARSILSLVSVTVLSLAMVPWAYSESKASDTNGPYTETKRQRDARMQWWREARFGMFVHWGLYSGLAGTWKGKPVGERGGMEWIQQRVGADTWEYAHEAVPLFRPKEGFAREWAKLARQAGCRYVVFTSKHHEGFCLFNSQYADYDAYDLLGRDLCREIVDAVRGEGLKVGFYHSVIDWHHPQYDYFNADQLPHPLKGKPSPNGPRNHDIYVDYLHHQVRELLWNYGDVDIIWWDYSKKGNEGPFWRADELMAMARRLQPAIISNNRLYHIPNIERDDSVGRLRTWKPQHGDFTTPEQTIPSTGIPGVDWEVCMTMNTTWGYSEHDHAWKSSETLIRNLVDIVSKGGNYLLNIGPKGDGSIPQESIDSMRAIGRWMETNGEAIYGTTASPFERPAWGRYTKKPGRIYAQVFQWPKDGMLEVPIGSLKVTRAYLLADTDKASLRTEKQPDALVIHVPAQAPDKVVPVVAIEYQQ
jgi:alpha-L-fucosidase